MINNSIDNGKVFDWGRTSESYAKYRNIYPTELYDRLKEYNVGKPGVPWLDMGTGTGILPINLFSKGSLITGIDISKEQIEQAKCVAENAGYSIDFFNRPAENTRLSDSSFDVITAAQCFMYFDKDKMVTEIERLLKPGGRFIKIYMGWLKDDVVIKSQELVKKHNPDWLTGKPMIKDMREHLFPVENMESFYSDIPFTRDSWTGRMKATRGVEASMSADQVKLFEEEHTELMLNFTSPEFTIRHKVFITTYKI